MLVRSIGSLCSVTRLLLWVSLNIMVFYKHSSGRKATPLSQPTIRALGTSTRRTCSLPLGLSSDIHPSPLSSYHFSPAGLQEQWGGLHRQSFRRDGPHPRFSTPTSLHPQESPPPRVSTSTSLHPHKSPPPRVSTSLHLHESPPT